jgi:hypothetical protein
MARRRNSLKVVQVVQRIRRTLSEMDYAQRRMFEIRTGLPATNVDRVRDNAMIAELEAHWRM